MRDPTSGRVPERAPERFLVATEACSDGTPDLGYVLGVSVYIRAFGAPTLVGSPGLFWPNSFTPWPSSGPKISFVKFQVNWTPFDFPFLQFSKTRKKIETGTGL